VFFVSVCTYSIFLLFVYSVCSFSTLILLVGSFLACKNRRPYNLYCVGGDVKLCSINQCVYCGVKCRNQSREPMQLFFVQRSTSPVRSCTSPILSRWQLFHTLCKCRTASRLTRHTIVYVQWANSMKPVS